MDHEQFRGSTLTHKYGTNELKLLLFKIADFHFGINISKVRQSLAVSRYQIHPITALNSPFLLGEMQVLDEMIPAISTAGYLEAEDKTRMEDRMAIVSEFDGSKCAFIVSEIVQNITVTWEDVIPVKPPISAASTVTGYILNSEQIIQLLDFEHIRDDIFGNCYNVEKIQPADGSNSKCILYAEDSMHVRRAIAGLLKSKGYDLEECENGQVAWEKYTQDPNKYAMVLSDIEMPIKDGTKLVVDIRNHPAGTNLPIVLMSSMTIEQNIKQYLDIGANAFVPKNKMEKLNDVLTEFNI